MPARRIDTHDGRAALAAAVSPGAPRAVTATAVRYLLQLLDEKAPGSSVEVRVPRSGPCRWCRGLGTPAGRRRTSSR